MVDKFGGILDRKDGNLSQNCNNYESDLLVIRTNLLNMYIQINIQLFITVLFLLTCAI